MTVIHEFHAHVYYNESTFEQASRLCDEAGEKFTLSVGQKHKKPVGPHPCWSCQLAFKPEAFGNIVPWLALNRHGLTIFIHANTGDDLKDHTEHTIWMGTPEPLNLDMFNPTA
ncbi:MAG: DOPA 4,5-dioxygenase family protein [Mariprofundaceae bacterium]|nr:DOPA 4,5-dioxygenase family protein [Mariprofundaceae bacterium]